MNKLHSRIISLSLLSALILSTFACGEQPTIDAETGGETTTTAPVETTDTKINWESSGLPEKDFGGREFTILTDNVSNLLHSWQLIAPDEQVGEALNDAMYNRNKKIEEIYNVTISSVYTTTLKDDANNSISAGEDVYSALFGRMDYTFTLAQEGKLMNYYDMPHINPDAEWWDETVVRDLSFRDSLYHLTGDISPATDSRVYTIVFNKDMCTELGLEMPYQYVLDGTWTLDRFNTYISDVNNDINGDGQMNYDDRWGFMSQDGCSWMMYMAGGGKVTEKNEQNEWVIAFDTERNIELAMESLKVASDKNKTLMANQYVTDHGGDWAAATAWFANGGSLFRSSVLEPIPRDLRTLEVNFGVVPFPKMDENQTQYYTLAEETSKLICVPVTADAEMAGLILESLAVESVETVKPAFYDVVLNGKVVRDEESKEMLDIIFANKVFDIGLTVNLASFKSMFTNLEKSGSTDIASSFASSISSAETALQKINDNLAGIQ